MNPTETNQLCDDFDRLINKIQLAHTEACMQKKAAQIQMSILREEMVNDLLSRDAAQAQFVDKFTELMDGHMYSNAPYEGKTNCPLFGVNAGNKDHESMPTQKIVAVFERAVASVKQIHQSIRSIDPYENSAEDELRYIETSKVLENVVTGHVDL